MKELGLFEAHLVEKLSGQRFSDEDRDLEFNAALGYVLKLREDRASAKSLSLNAHKQEFESWFWDVTNEEIEELFKKNGFSNSEEEQADDPKEK
ncbi:hypothetical protein HQO26_05310 [Rhodococcus fascians]|nr:hypothetical protein [Rhodococcus fascians]MBY4416276.1 hypothetical protein [Rhodococcus fascians]